MKKISLLTAIILIALILYFDWSMALSIAIGIIWGAFNLYFIRELLTELFLASPKNILKICLLTLVKFPLLYLIGFGLLLFDQVTPGSCLIGFIIVIAASTQQWFWLPLQRIKSRQHL